MKNMCSILVCCAAVAAFASPADADVKWATVGSGCVVDSAYASKAVVNSQTGAVSFASGQTGWVLMSCPISTPFNSASSCVPARLAKITTSDTGSSNHYVKGWVNYTAYGSNTGVSSLGVVSSPVSTARTLSSTSVGSFDFETYYYWVNVEMYRSNTTYNPTFHGAQIEMPTCIL